MKLGLGFILNGLPLLAFMAGLQHAQAELMSPKHLPRLAQVDETKIIVGQDLKARLIYRGSFLIQTTEAEVPKLRTLSFDRNEMKLKYFKAWTVKASKLIPVGNNLIQVNPINEESGFSKMMGVEVAFPKMNVGSVIQWAYELEEIQTPLHGFFSHVLHLDSEYYPMAGFSFDIESQVPLELVNADYGKLLNIKKTSKGYSVRLKQSLNQSVINESYGFMSRSRYPTLLFSSAKNWSQVAGSLLQSYESRLSEPLPPFLSQALAKLQTIKGFSAQTQMLHKILKEHVRYMGDWRGRFSGQVPRSLKAIAESQFGDCKDYSLMAVRVLRELGYQAYFASVLADRSPVPDIYYKIPVNYFNHQIVYVRIGKTDYWIDPTSMDDISFLDDSLVNRSAVVWEKKPTVRKIPKYDESQNGFQYRLVLNPTLIPGQFSGDLEVESWGLESKFSKGDEESSNPMLKWLLIFFPDVKARSQEFHVHSPKVKRPWASRQRGIGVFENVFDKTPVGDGFRVGFSNFLRAILDVNKTWKSDFDFGFPSRRDYEVLIRNRNFVGIGSESCSVDSKWMSVNLSLKNSGHNAQLVYSESFKTTEIPNTELRSEKFQNFQNQIRTCLVGRVMILGMPGATIQRGMASTDMHGLRTGRQDIKMPPMKLLAKSSTTVPDPVGGGAAPSRNVGPTPTIKLKRISASSGAAKKKKVIPVKPKPTPAKPTPTPKKNSKKK